MRISRLHLTLALVVAGSLALAGCGRQGPLEPPPSALTGQGTPAATAQPASPFNGGLFGAEDQSYGDSAFGPDGKPLEGKSTKKKFILDPLID